MADHDPLCPMLDDSLPPICVCGVIARVRADERQRIAQAIEAEAAKDWGGDHVDGLHDAARIARDGGSDE